MKEDFSEDILFRVVAQLCQMVGFQSVLSSSLYTLTDILRQLILYLGKRARSYSEHCGRTSVELSDLFRTFSDLQIYPSELVDFCQTIGPLPLPISVPKYPVAFNRNNHLRLDKCNVVECVHFKSEEQVKCSTPNRLSPPQKPVYLSTCIGLNESTVFNQSSLEESNGLHYLSPNSEESRESLKITISLADIKRAQKKKDSKKQKKEINKLIHKKRKKNKEKHRSAI